MGSHESGCPSSFLARFPEASTCEACATYRKRAQLRASTAVPSFYMCACAFGTCIRRGARHRRTLQHDVLQCPESASGLRGVGGGGKRGPGFATQNGFTQILLKNLDWMVYFGERRILLLLLNGCLNNLFLACKIHISRGFQTIIIIDKARRKCQFFMTFSPGLLDLARLITLINCWHPTM